MHQDGWYPTDKKELENFLEKALEKKIKFRGKINGLIVPHAGYSYSGMVAGKAFAFLKGRKFKKAVIFGPSHHVPLHGLASLDKIETPLGKVKITKNNLPKLEYEHSVINEVPFLQKLGINEVYPVIVGEINDNEAGKIAKNFSKHKALFIFSTDLSHFLPYGQAIQRDNETIKIIEKLDLGRFEKVDACGKNCLRIMAYLCMIKKWKPHLIEYKNSGDVIVNKESVVGYASFML